MYEKVKDKQTNKRNRPKRYTGEKGWMLTTKNDKGKIVSKENFGSLSILADKRKELSYANWRNVSQNNIDKWKKIYILKRINNPT